MDGGSRISSLLAAAEPRNPSQPIIIRQPAKGKLWPEPFRLMVLGIIVLDSSNPQLGMRDGNNQSHTICPSETRWKMSVARRRTYPYVLYIHTYIDSYQQICIHPQRYQFAIFRVHYDSGRLTLAGTQGLCDP